MAQEVFDYDYYITHGGIDLPPWQLAFPFLAGSLTWTWNGYVQDPTDLIDQDPDAGTFNVDSALTVHAHDIFTIFYELQTEPTPGFWLDFDKDGFDGTDEITSDVIAFTWNRGGTPDLVGGVQPGQATLVLKNPGGKYTRAASAFTALLIPGRPVWVGVNGDGTVNGADSTFISQESHDALLQESGDRILLE